ncbi:MULTISPECIES: calcium:proton antiporter [Rhizobium]|uniref:Ca2+/H+ antiporter n=1 Tax=Rhizobium favelukesii TaxID=348824 RepID=W6RRP7_9HYPH|nr:MULTISPECIES: calcium:proton antiporter [Rhizobium]MCS0461842.1 calcium:proton antiporter [Rhizobium favelukesii]UFS79283.1 calcium:proton antiporter [Rhizobium sp. T136]CDM62815.1 Ca2+/H+ antiporter [Rhizobium favelukesii]
MNPEVAVPQRPRLALIRREWLLLVSIATSVVFLLFGEVFFGLLANPIWLAVIFVWLFSVVLGSALSVVRHADHLAEQLGEPYGTLILTLAITSIEVMAITAVMRHGESNPTLVRDTLFAVVMIILNGMVGLSLLMGGWRRHEQHHNLQGANAYLGVIVPLATLSMIMPNFTHPTNGPPYSPVQQTVLAFISVGLYGVFLTLQTGRHRGFFIDDAGEAAGGHGRTTEGPLWPPVILLVAYMALVVFLVEQLAAPIDYFIETLRAPAALGGVVMAVLVATPEAISAVRASVANHLQRSVNIFLGSVLSTIGLTVPAMLVISHLTGHPVVLGLERTDAVMLILTLALSIITFASGRTHLMQGAVHLVLFVAYFLLIFEV